MIEDVDEGVASIIETPHPTMPGDRDGSGASRSCIYGRRVLAHRGDDDAITQRKAADQKRSEKIGHEQPQ